MQYSSPESYIERSRGGLSIPLFLVAALILCILGAVLTPALAGIMVGYQQLQIENHENAILHYQRGLGYLAENYPELAYSEFQVAAKYDASYEPAQQKLSEMQATLGSNAKAGSQSGNLVAATLFDDARRAFAEKQWDDAINRLEQLKSIQADYQTQGVNEMLYQAYVEDGKAAISDGHIESARERFDAALTIRNDAEVRRQRDLAALYLDGQQAVGYDWLTAIQKFSTLYQQDPNYDDVKSRLVDAYNQYGDLAAKQNAWCLAAREYDNASAISSDAQIAQKRTNAMARCKQAIVATPTLTVLLTPGAEYYVWKISTAAILPCNGLGDVSGVVRDALGNPLIGFYVAYDAEGINRVTARTDVNGQYKFTLGKDSGLLHVYMLSGDGKTPAGIAASVQYPGGTNSGCHIVVDWQKVQ